MNQIQTYPLDREYISAALENGVQCFAQAQALGDLYVFNGGGADVFVLVQDNAAGPGAPGATRKSRIYPVAAGGYVFRSWAGKGRDFGKGLYVGAYSTAALAAAGGAPDAGNVLWVEANYGRGRLGTVPTADPKGMGN